MLTKNAVTSVVAGKRIGRAARQVSNRTVLVLEDNLKSSLDSMQLCPLVERAYYTTGPMLKARLFCEWRLTHVGVRCMQEGEPEGVHALPSMTIKLPAFIQRLARESCHLTLYRHQERADGLISPSSEDQRSGAPIHHAAARVALIQHE